MHKKVDSDPFKRQRWHERNQQDVKKYINNQPTKMMMTMITLYISRDLHTNTDRVLQFSSVTHNVSVTMTMKLEKDFDFLLPCMRLNVQHFMSQFWNSHIFAMLISGFLQHNNSHCQAPFSLSFDIDSTPCCCFVTATTRKGGWDEARKCCFWFHLGYHKFECNQWESLTDARLERHFKYKLL